MPSTVLTRAAIAREGRRDEAARVAALAADLGPRPYDPDAVAATARALVVAVREERRSGGGLDSLMQEFSLSSQEGVALLCLAEALLRIPDASTADLLIRDILARGDWGAHLGHSPSFFVNAAAWGLMLTGRLVATASARSLGGALSRALARGGEPLLRKSFAAAVELLGERFVMGEDIASALARSASAAARGYVHSFDMLGEAALTADDAEAYWRAYREAIEAVGAAAAGSGVRLGPGVSVKLSALHPRYTPAQGRRVMAELLPRLTDLAVCAAGWNIGLSIDAEESERLELSLDLLEALLELPELAGWEGLGFVVQAYQKRATAVVDHLIALARQGGRPLMVRLVKGAYWDAEIKRAQVEGLAGYPVFTRKRHTDLSYLACAVRLLAAAPEVFPQFATHNAHTVAAVAALAGPPGGADFEFQCLHGMGEALYDRVLATPALARRVRIYAPVGSHRTLLPYLVRRLLENGANTSFVHRLVDDAVPLDALVSDPVAGLATEGGGLHPGIPLPAALFGPARRNSAGVDLADREALAALAAELEASRSGTRECRPRLAVGAAGGVREGARPVFDPAKAAVQVGQVWEATAADVAAAVAAATTGGGAWAALAPGERAARLEQAAAALEADRAELFPLLVREAGKTWGNALGEIREAADFLRYYAAQARLSGGAASRRGGRPVACISPWNFPLAIFVGQVAAALAAGHPVLAKPAEQTPLVADRAVALLHGAGIPAAALQLLPGPGETVGQALVAHPAVVGVLFTGSLAVAAHIDRSLAARAEGEGLPWLVAETGGVNALVVDSSALPEQVVRDVLASGFDSAGQRCSALRLLCVQEEIAAPLLQALSAALAELRLGDPAEFATDVGPLIDAAAREAVEAHLAAMAARGFPVRRPPGPVPAGGHFCPPALVEINRASDVPGEVFGPVVHVLRYPAGGLEALAGAIDALGYGLTFAIHSRIDESIATLAGRVRAGNVYVNRNQIGAVVGVQPFGGEGLSGTGPKAGGPLLLPFLMGMERPDFAALGFRPGAEYAPQEALLALAAWARSRGQAELAAACARCEAESPLGLELALPGPTGEANRLFWAPRGGVLCASRSAAGLLTQIAATLATGNRFRPAQAGLLPADLAPLLQPWRLPEGEAVTAVLVDGREDEILWRRRRAADEGARVPVLAPGEEGRFALHRLLVERVRTVNTAAAGGNAELMGLGD
jgi:RHH-type proline utilization regulon transcriptional repressor/proline dehydrogenase/delta 1-pyrroline-5-carboxylate dehydrogenase